MLTYLKIFGAFGVFASAASDKIEARPQKFRHHHQMLSREQAEIGAAIVGAGAAGAIAGLGLGAMGSSPGGGDGGCLGVNLNGGCLGDSAFKNLISRWKESSVEEFCPTAGCAVGLDRFVDDTVDNDVSLILTKYSKVASEDAKVVWNYGCATCAPDLSTDAAVYAFIGNVNLTTGQSLPCPPLVDAYAGQIFDAQILDGCLQAWKAAGQSPASYLFCATYVDNKLVYTGPAQSITFQPENPDDTAGPGYECPP